MSAMNVCVSVSEVVEVLVPVVEEVSGVIAPVAFNASITVTELLTKTLENAAKELAVRCIRECATKYGFVAEEAIRALGLENLNLIKKKMTKKSGSKSSSSKPIAAKKEKKSVFPMPFEASIVVETNCQGLSFNRGLFTQCSKEKMENSSFCKGCQTEADKNSSGCPDCGTVACRLATDLYSFKDPKGRSPVSYVKLLEKLKLSVEDALTEAGNKNIELSNDHFTVVEKSSKGRPKKSAKPVESSDNAGDLFAKLTAEHEEDMFEMDDLDKDNSSNNASSKASNKAKLSDEEKALKKAALEEERAAKKLLAQQQREAAIALEKEAKKLERETKAALEKEAKKLERETKAALEKAARETKTALEKAARETKVAEEKAAREAKRLLEKELKKESKKAASPKTTPVVVVAPVSPPVKKVGVTRMAFGGIQYLKSENNMLYNPETKEEVGIWDPETKTIKELPEEEESDEEEEEEGYETN
jgi:flagellar biosynthesis GTPase FlhF